jgi:hypothetical protein
LHRRRVQQTAEHPNRIFSPGWHFPFGVTPRRPRSFVGVPQTAPPSSDANWPNRNRFVESNFQEDGSRKNHLEEHAPLRDALGLLSSSCAVVCASCATLGVNEFLPPGLRRSQPMYEAADMNGAPLRALFTGVSPVNTSIICVIAREGLGGHYRPSIRSGNLIWPDVGGRRSRGNS